MDDDITCSPDDIAEVLQYSLAAVQYPLSDDIQYNLHHDTTWMLAYALDSILKREEYDDLPWDTPESELSGSAGSCECNCLVDYKSRGFAPMLMRRHLLAVNFTGLSVSTKSNTVWKCMHVCMYARNILGYLGSDYFGR